MDFDILWSSIQGSNWASYELECTWFRYGYGIGIGVCLSFPVGASDRATAKVKNE